MDLSPSLQQFIREHADDDPARLLLAASRYPGIDISFAVEQIAARRQIRDKLPGWHAEPTLIFPAKIAAEQCSSESTAAYKQQLIDATDHVCDLTGGLGIDTFYLSRQASHITYIERFPRYCEAARHNFAQLGATNITVCEGDSAEWVDRFTDITVFYIDPARRGEGNKRVFALSDCEPDLPALLPQLWQKAPRVIAKISPMADIRQTLALLPGTTAIHVVSVRNECKELLFVLERDAVENKQETSATEPLIYCVNLAPDKPAPTPFTFTLADEQQAEVHLASQVKAYLYEPNASILKAGAFKQLAISYNLDKLASSSHLYTADEYREDFPGRTFRIAEVLPFTNRLCKELAKACPQANITVRNFPLSVDELRRRTHITDGGDTYLFASTLANGDKVILRCTRLP